MAFEASEYEFVDVRNVAEFLAPHVERRAPAGHVAGDGVGGVPHVLEALHRRGGRRAGARALRRRVALTGSWAGLVEMLRLRNEHISYRAGQLPTSRHPWPVAAAAAAGFALAAAAAFRRSRRAAHHGPPSGSRPPAGRVSLRIGRRPDPM